MAGGGWGTRAMCSSSKPWFSIPRGFQGVFRACLRRALGLCRYTSITALASLAIKLLNLCLWLAVRLGLVSPSLNPVLRNILPRFCSFYCWCFIKSKDSMLWLCRGPDQPGKMLLVWGTKVFSVPVSHTGLVQHYRHRWVNTRRERRGEQSSK